MVTNYYNASNNFSRPIRKEPKPYMPPKEITAEPLVHFNTEIPQDKTEKTPDISLECAEKEGLSHSSPSLSSENLLILGVLFLLWQSGTKDFPLLFALLYLLIK